MPISDRQWLAALILAVLLHGLLWCAVVWSNQTVEPTTDSPRGVMISLDDFDSRPPPAATAPQAIETASPNKATTVPADQSADVAPADTPAQSTADIPTAASAPIGPEKAAQTTDPSIPDAASTPPPAADASTTPAGESTASPTAAVSVTPDNIATDITPTQQVTARDATTLPETGNDDSDRAVNGAYGNSTQTTDDYIVQLRAWLARHKQYPKSARRAGEQGTVKLYLAIDPSGRVLEHRIVKSSGADTLDQAANRMLERALPLPAMPAASDQRRLEIVIPVVFTLH